VQKNAGDGTAEIPMKKTALIALRSERKAPDGIARQSVTEYGITAFTRWLV